MRLCLLPFAFFALAVQARAEVTLTVSDTTAEYSDDAFLEARLMNGDVALNNQIITFSLEREDDEGNFRPVGASDTAPTDTNGIARGSIRLVNGMTAQTTHELKPDRSEEERWASYSSGDYRIVARRQGGDFNVAYGTLTIRREQAALTVLPVTTVAGYEPTLKITLEDNGDNTRDWDFENGEAVQSNKVGIQGREVSLWMDRNGDQQFYNCTAGGTCVDGHCVQCQSDEDCPGSVCDLGLCVAEVGENQCSADEDCSPFFGVQGLNCLAGVCVAEACDYLGTATTDNKGQAFLSFSTTPNEFGDPTVGYHELMLRAEFGGDEFYAGGGSKGDLEIAPGPLDMNQVPLTITRNNEQVTEVGTTEAVALEVRAYLSDNLGNLYGFNDKPYQIAEGDCASCAEDLCQDVMHPQCLIELNPADLVFEASSGIFITEIERNATDGAFVRKWRPNYSDDSEVRFTVKLGDLSSQPKTIRLFDTSGCGCSSTHPVTMLWWCALFLLRRRRQS